jgi:hypothetical protein
MIMKKQMTLIELKQQNPFGYKKLLIALNRNRVSTPQKKQVPKFKKTALNKIVKLINNL